MAEKKNEYDLILEKATKKYKEAKEKGEEIPTNFIEYIKKKNQKSNNKNLSAK